MRIGGPQRFCMAGYIWCCIVLYCMAGYIWRDIVLPDMFGEILYCWKYLLLYCTILYCIVFSAYIRRDIVLLDIFGVIRLEKLRLVCCCQLDMILCKPFVENLPSKEGEILQTKLSLRFKEVRQVYY